MKGGTLFSGGGGFCLGMVAAGVDHAWGIELSDDIAAVARMNGLNTITADILQCNPADFEPVDFLHASPPCPNFSNAKTNGEETELDRALAGKVCEFIVELLPRVFTLENVYQYRNSQSWETIARTLLTHGYSVNYWHVNMADYGVPQTRKRMIAIARRDGMTPMLPPATHDEKPQVQLFGVKDSWVSWDMATSDLVGTLPDATLTTRHKRLMPPGRKHLLTNQNNRETMEPQFVLSGMPCVSLTAQSLLGWRLIDGQQVKKPNGHFFARIGAFPDTYHQPRNNMSLACRIIGNAIPPLFAQRLVEWLI